LLANPARQCKKVQGSLDGLGLVARRKQIIVYFKEAVEMMKRLFFFAVAFVAVLFFVSRGTARAAEPIKIGFMAPYVGVFSQLGNDLRNGFKLALEEAGYKAAGRQIVLIDEDTEGKPEVGLSKTRKLVEKDQVQILAGLVNSAVAYAVRDYVISKKVPLVLCSAAGTKLTQELRDPYIFRVSMANGQEELVAGWYAASKLGAKRVIIMAPDYSAGYEKVDGFLKTFKAAGGEVVDSIYPPLGTNDFAPYLAKVTPYVGKVDRVWAFFSGSDAIRFINQYEETGLKDRIKLWVDGGTVDEAILPSMSQAALGVDNYQHYAPSLDTPENRRFVKAYQQRYKEMPAQLADQGYVGGKVIVKAIETVKGNIENQAAFLKALKNVKFEAPRGAFRFDEQQNVIFNVYIRRVVNENGRYFNRVIDTIPDVGQYWMPKK
jgi:branched-chain amino acid transport system substrate-binding protein